MKEVIERAGAPTPAFFRKLRNLGVLLAGLSTTILASATVMPALLITIAGYAAVGGTVLGIVCQLVKEGEK
ncbi:MAG: hypothetical protein ABIS69_11655 [Sediminibacterium sp.]